ncbi:MAG: site-specific DNA-methyltransferase [Candidatus Contendobacter sp.]|nr:site-specific DNA-methyltransferase [Candidatus Contendobacter sp.]
MSEANPLDRLVIELAPGITIIRGDCRDVLPVKCDAVVTDPPYGIGISSNPFRQKHDKKKWDDDVPEQELIDQIVMNSPVSIIWGGNYFNLPPTQRFLVWDKIQPDSFSSSMCEMAWTNLSGPAKLYRKHVVSYRKYHPTTKPEELMAWCLSFLDDFCVILDPFMGSGTTGVACIRTGRRFIGIEIDPTYFDIARRRLEKELAQGRLALAG